MDELDLNAIEKRLEQAIAPLDSIQFHHHVNMRRDVQTLLIEVRRLRQVIVTVEETYLETLCETQRERDEAQRIVELLVIADHINQEDVDLAAKIAQWK